jgi:hypothetical protein
MTPWVRHTLAAYRFNTSYRIPGVGWSNLGAVKRSIPACTSWPTAGRYVQISQISREPSADSRSRTTPKMSGIEASNICGAGDVFGCLLYRCNSSLLGTATQRRTRTCWRRQLDPFFRGKCTTSLFCIRFAVLSYVSSAKVLAHNCMGLLPVYELPSSKYHYLLATMVANLAKLTPEQPALIPRDDERQAHESGLNNLGVRCQRASMAVAVMVCPTQ